MLSHRGQATGKKCTRILFADSVQTTPCYYVWKLTVCVPVFAQLTFCHKYYNPTPVSKLIVSETPFVTNFFRIELLKSTLDPLPLWTKFLKKGKKYMVCCCFDARFMRIISFDWLIHPLIRGCMDEWMNEWMNKWMGGCSDWVTD